MPSIFQKLGNSLANIRDSYHFSVPSKAMRENNLPELETWLNGTDPSYDEVTTLLYSAPTVGSAATLGRHLRDHYTPSYRELLDTYISHAFDTQQGKQPGNPSDLTSTRSGLLLLGLLQSMGNPANDQRKAATPLGQPEGFLSFEQELKLMQIGDERAYRTASESSPPVKHFIDYSPLLDLDAQSFERFCRIGIGRHAGLDPGNMSRDNQAPDISGSNLRSNLLNVFADHLISSPKPRYDLVESALRQNVFNVEELVFAVSVHSPRHLGKATASFNSSTEAIGARLEAKKEIVARFASPELCLKEAAKLTFTEQLDSAYKKKLNDFYQADPNIAERLKRQPEDLVRHLDGLPAEVSEIANLNSPVAQYTRVLAALKAPQVPEEKDKFCQDVLKAMQPNQPLQALTEPFGHALWQSLTAALSPEFQDRAKNQDKNWRFRAAQDMKHEHVTLGAARSIAHASISEHYDLLRELVETDNVRLVSELCDRSPNKPQSRMNASEAMLLGDLTHTAHRPPIFEKIVSAEMLDAILPGHVPSGQQQLQEKEELVRRIERSTLPDKLLDNNKSDIPPASKAQMLGVLLQKTGVTVSQPSLENMLDGNSPVKSQMMVQLVKHGSFGTRKNLLFAAARCPDEELQETIVDELLTRPLSIEEDELDKFAGASPRTQEMLEKAVAAEQLTLPPNKQLTFAGPDIS
jgi:hypothetical protein